MLMTLFLSALLQAPPAQEASAITHRPALPALVAKAPGKPEYGLHISSPQGQFIFTNLRYSPLQPKGDATLYRVTGPAAMGPYRLGTELGGPSKFTKLDVSGRYQGNFFEIKKVVDGSAAKEAGLDEDWSILSVDGQNFGWNIQSLIAYMTTRPAIEVAAIKAKGWGMGSTTKTFQIQLRKLEALPDPTDAFLVPEQVDELKPFLAQPTTLFELVRSRSALPRFKALPVELQGETLWVVRGVPTFTPQPTGGRDRFSARVSRGAPMPQPQAVEAQGGIVLEFWKQEPGSNLAQSSPAALCAEPIDGLVPGRVFTFQGRWLRVQEVEVEAPTGRLAKLRLAPWAADVTALLSGATLASNLGSGAQPGQQEALEQQANDALVEWKTRTLPGLLANQGLAPTEDLVVRAEKGLLLLDLEVKGIRSRLDAKTRAEAEQKAHAQLAATGRGAAPPPTVLPTTESERLADLLDQRKAILMAILGSAKQALVQQRR